MVCRNSNSAELVECFFEIQVTQSLLYSSPDGRYKHSRKSSLRAKSLVPTNKFKIPRKFLSSEPHLKNRRLSTVVRRRPNHVDVNPSGTSTTRQLFVLPFSTAGSSQELWLCRCIVLGGQNLLPKPLGARQRNNLLATPIGPTTRRPS